MELKGNSDQQVECDPIIQSQEGNKDNTQLEQLLQNYLSNDKPTIQNKMQYDIKESATSSQNSFIRQINPRFMHNNKQEQRKKSSQFMGSQPALVFQRFQGIYVNNIMKLSCLEDIFLMNCLAEHQSSYKLPFEISDQFIIKYLPTKQEKYGSKSMRNSIISAQNNKLKIFEQIQNKLRKIHLILDMNQIKILSKQLRKACLEVLETLNQKLIHTINGYYKQLNITIFDIKNQAKCTNQVEMQNHTFIFQTFQFKSHCKIFEKYSCRLEQYWCVFISFGDKIGPFISDEFPVQEINLNKQQ